MAVFGFGEKKVKRELPRGYERGQERPAEARWYDPKGFAKGWEYHDAKGRAAGIFLGHWEGKLLGRIDDRHVMTVAGSRGGKGESLIKPNLWFYDGSMVVTDPKGELARDTSEHREKKLGQRVVILDPFRASGIKTDMGWNPLEELDLGNDDAIDDALSIAEAMVQVPERGETHWSEAAQSLVQALILMTKLLPEDARDLCTMRDLLMCRHEMVLGLAAGEPQLGEQGASQPEGQEPKQNKKRTTPTKALFYLMQQVGETEAAKHREGPQLRAAELVQGIGISYADMVDRELESVLSTARTQTRFLESDALRRVLRKHSIRLRDIKREPTTLYLCLPAKRMATHAKWLRIVVNMAMGAFEDDFKPEIPVLVLLDEFPVLGHMRSLEVAAGQLASFGVKLWIVVQDLTQLQKIYGEHTWETFVGNAGILTFFANNDMATLKYISERLGQRAFLVKQPSSMTSDGRFAGGAEMNETLRGEPLLTGPEARMHLDRDSLGLLVFTPRDAPALMDRVLFHKHKELFKD